jgi:hypothetical protein
MYKIVLLFSNIVQKIRERNKNMRNNLKRTLALLLAVIMTVCVIPFTALSADDSDAVTLLAADMAITLNNNGKNFYGNRALDTESGIYNFTGEKNG